MKENRIKNRNIRWTLVFYDMIVYTVVAVLLLGLYSGNDKLSVQGLTQQIIISALCIFAVRIMGNVYGQVWR